MSIETATAIHHTRQRVLRPPAGLCTLVFLVTFAVAASACGDGSDSTAATAPVSADGSTATSAAAPTVTTGSTVTTAATSPATTGTTATTAGSSTTAKAKRPTANDLERDLEATINDDGTYPGRATCEFEGPLADWQAILCYYLPDDPGEFGGIHVVVFGDGRYAWALGECCGGGPWAEHYASGLMCKDLVKPPSDQMEHPDSYHLSYGLAVWYWVAERRPDRMDADHNGIPCETVYPKSDVDKYWASARTIP